MRILISYHYYRNADLDRLMGEFPTPPEVFADSGAFSAMTQGAPIDLHEYAEWLQRWGHHFTTYANLDVIGDADTTAVNQRVLEDRYGLHPLPVFHVREPWEALDEYLAAYDYVALGVAGTRSSDYLPWVVRCHRMAREHGTALHGFGITDHRVCAALPWFSIDSSSWGKGHRYWWVTLWDHRRGKFRTFKMADRAAAYEHADLLRAHGAEPEWFATRAAYDRSKMVAVNALAFMRFEAWLRQRHGAIPCPASELGDGVRRYVTEHGDDPDGMRLYLADGSVDNLQRAADGVRMYLADARAGTKHNDLAVASLGPRDAKAPA